MPPCGARWEHVHIGWRHLANDTARSSRHGPSSAAVRSIRSLIRIQLPDVSQIAHQARLPAVYFQLGARIGHSAPAHRGRWPPVPKCEQPVCGSQRPESRLGRLRGPPAWAVRFNSARSVAAEVAELEPPLFPSASGAEVTPPSVTAEAQWCPSSGRAVPLASMAKSPDEEFSIGDRVRCLEFPVKDLPGTIVRRGRVLHLKVWLVQLDRQTGRSGGLVRIRKLEKLTPEGGP